MMKLLLILVLAAPALAGAHAGADGGGHHGLLAGLLHPLTGVDHLLVMIAVGLWSAFTARHRADWQRAPLVFATLLLAGALLAAGGVRLPMVETSIAVSVVVLGLLVATGLALPALPGALLVGTFAVFHGAAHGQELVGLPAIAGMVLGTALLHGAGIVAGLQLRQHPAALVRGLGAAVVAYGALLLAA